MPDFERPPLHQMTRELAATAMGRLPATLVVRGGTLVSVTSGEILPNMSVAVQGSRIAYIGPDASHKIGDETRVIEAGGRYIVPGFPDDHRPRQPQPDGDGQLGEDDGARSTRRRRWGGAVAVATREELTLLPLPVAGLMSPEPYEEVAERSKAIGEVLVRTGCRLNNAFMTLSFLALVVHPELHVSDKGLVGVGEQGSGFVEVIERG